MIAVAYPVPRCLALSPQWLMALLAVLALGGEPVREALRYDSGAIDAGQWWRVLSAAVVHLGWWHCS